MILAQPHSQRDTAGQVSFFPAASAVLLHMAALLPAGDGEFEIDLESLHGVGLGDLTPDMLRFLTGADVPVRQLNWAVACTAGRGCLCMFVW